MLLMKTLASRSPSGGLGLFIKMAIEQEKPVDPLQPL